VASDEHNELFWVSPALDHPIPFAVGRRSPAHRANVLRPCSPSGYNARMTVLGWFVGCTSPVGLGGRPVDEDDTRPTVVSSEPCDACGGDCLLEELDYAEAYHASGGVDYVDTPPAGGPHDPCWAPFGVHPEPVPDERWVHNLEHGAVVFLHHESACDGDCSADVLSLEGFTATSEWALSTPYDALDTPFAALSWGYRLTLGCWDPALAATFYDEHLDQGPESVLSGPSQSCM
jgi:hypothetical protein